MSEHEMTPGGPLPIETLLLIAADGEDLSSEDGARLDAYLQAHPEAAGRVDFEQQLRGRCGHVMGDVSSPAGLEDRLRQRLQEERVAELASVTRDPGFWASMGPIRASIAAAILVLAIGVAVSRLFAPSAPSGNNHWVQVASFLNTEHEQTERDPGTPTHREFRTFDELKAACESSLGCQPELRGLESLEFLGGGVCQIPGGGTSLHLEFATGRSDAPVVSLFLQVRCPLADSLPEESTYVIGEQDRSARVWRRASVTYYGVASSPEACAQACAGFGAPDRNVKMQGG